MWHAPATQPADRKAMLRLAIEVIRIAPIDVSERRTHIQVQWQSGAVDELPVARIHTPRTPREGIQRIEELAADGMQDAAIACAGYRTHAAGAVAEERRASPDDSIGLLRSSDG